MDIKEIKRLAKEYTLEELNELLIDNSGNGKLASKVYDKVSLAIDYVNGDLEL